MLRRRQANSRTIEREGEKGQAIIDYALILFLCSTVSIGVLTLLGTSILDLYQKVENAVAAFIP